MWSIIEPVVWSPEIVGGLREDYIPLEVSSEAVAHTQVDSTANTCKSNLPLLGLASVTMCGQASRMNTRDV